MSVEQGEGYAIGSLQDLGEGPGFRKVRRELGVTAFGVNAIVLPAGYTSDRHKHEEQEELYFVHQGSIDLLLGDGTEHRMEPGTFARVDAGTVRALRNAGDSPAVYVCVGGKDGYVGRDGVKVDD